MTFLIIISALALLLVTAACVYAVKQAASVVREARNLPSNELSH